MIDGIFNSILFYSLIDLIIRILYADKNCKNPLMPVVGGQV